LWLDAKVWMPRAPMVKQGVFDSICQAEDQQIYSADACLRLRMTLQAGLAAESPHDCLTHVCDSIGQEHQDHCQHRGSAGHREDPLAP
jgi:hypothetical protein